MIRRAAGIAIVAVVALVSSGCLAAKGNTALIQFVSTTTQNGWKFDYYRNSAYPCSVSGYQTFVIGTKVGAPVATPRPLWAFMHGGGAGYFDASGNPVPNANHKTEEGAASLRSMMSNPGLQARVRADAAAFRMLAVSYCNHDVYGGFDTPDPNNPNTTPDGKARTTNGLLATKAAIQFAQSLYPTTKTFLHGGSAGSAGAYYVAWSMQQQQIPLAGVVADASIVNVEAMQAANAAGICTEDNSPERAAAISGRVHPDVANIANEADKLVAGNHLTVPLLHIWNHGDVNTCGSPPIACPMRNGSTVTLGLTDCIHEPMRQAIAAQGPTSRSKNLPVCVDDDAVADCSVHVITNKSGLTNTDPATPADFMTAIMDWVHARLADA